jgi:hypothetical protein
MLTECKKTAAFRHTKPTTKAKSSSPGPTAVYSERRKAFLDRKLQAFDIIKIYGKSHSSLAHTRAVVGAGPGKHLLPIKATCQEFFRRSRPASQADSAESEMASYG